MLNMCRFLIPERYPLIELKDLNQYAKYCAKRHNVCSEIGHSFTWYFLLNLKRALHIESYPPPVKQLSMLITISGSDQSFSIIQNTLLNCGAKLTHQWISCLTLSGITNFPFVGKVLKIFKICERYTLPLLTHLHAKFNKPASCCICLREASVLHIHSCRMCLISVILSFGMESVSFTVLINIPKNTITIHGATDLSSASFNPKSFNSCFSCL